MEQQPILEDSIQQQRICLLLEYYGPAFSGSQMQANAYSVQQALGEALTQLNIDHTSLTLAGRTDAGVHAKGQIAHFDCPIDGLRHIPELTRALNAVLPDTLSVRNYAITDDFEFHAICSAQWRWYQYRIYNQPTRSVWNRREDAAWIQQPLSVQRMQEASKYFLGEHDFSSFKCPRKDVQNNVCKVIYSNIYTEGNDIVYNIVANRFIYKMVRNIMGLLIDIGLEDNRKPEDIPDILAKKDRQAAGLLIIQNHGTFFKTMFMLQV
jgi:tRNA pseudouridine38-40 synthase